MKRSLFFAAFASALLLASCGSTDTASSDAVKQSEIFQSYTVTYDAGDRELYGSASFRFGGSTGTTLNLAGGSGIQLDGESLATENNMFSGTFYRLSKQAEFKGKYAFRFEDCEKKVYTNTAEFNAIEVAEFPEKADKSTGLMVKWLVPLKNNETVFLYLEDSKNNTASTSTTVVGANSIELSTDQMNNIVPGQVNIYLVRETNNALAEATHLGGNMYTQYTSKKVGLNLSGEAPETAAK
jgi:hypothetical protein